MKTNNPLKIVLVIIVLSLITYSGFIEYDKNTRIKDEGMKTSGEGIGQSVGIVLIIENERNGEIIYKMEKDDDLAVRSMAGLIHYMIKGNDATASHGYDMTTGAIKTFDMTSTYGNMFQVQTCIRIGTGTTAPTYEDYKLETEIYYDEVEAIGYSVSGLQMNATFVTTFNIDDTYSITECSINGHDNTGSGAVHFKFIYFRDVFSAINVISGDLLTVKYVIMFN